MPQQNYRQILERIAKRHAQFQPANGEIETHAVGAREGNHKSARSASSAQRSMAFSN